MEQEKMRSFRLRYSLKDKKTGNYIGVRETIVKGIDGNSAVYHFEDELRKEGRYELDESYSYCEVPDSNHK